MLNLGKDNDGDYNDDEEEEGGDCCTGNPM